MLDKEDLQAIAQLMDLKLGPINNRLDTMGGGLDTMDGRLDTMDGRLNTVGDKLNSIDERLSNVEEDTKITRNAVNDLLEWADDASIQDVPLFKKSK